MNRRLLDIVLVAACAGHSRAQTPAPSPVADALARADAAVQAIVDVSAARTFDNTVGALDDLLVRLDTETAMIQFMAHVSTKAEERAAGMTAEQDVTNWKIDLITREDLYRAVKAFSETGPKLGGEQAKLLKELTRDFRRAGMELPREKRDELVRIQKEVTRLGLEFQKNIADDETRVPLTRPELPGMSEEYLNGLKRSGDVYLVSLDYPTYIPLIEQCSSEQTRAKCFIAYKRRGGSKNVALIEQILKLRAQAASLLGYASPADYETEVRMARNAQAVFDFYEKLRPIVRKKARLDFDELQAAKRAETKDPQARLAAWDQPYYENYLRKTRYAVDSEQVKEYFPMERVVDGLFSITQALYGIEYRDVTDKAASKGRALWHEDVRLFEVWDKTGNQLLGEFYIDLFPRPNKYTHAACWGLHARKRFTDGTLQKPLAAMVCNFPKPTPDKPSLLPHDDVETFFHEFGHCLHNILTEADYGWFAGTNVARDFVEAPSQMFENWVWDARVLKTFARHYQSGQPIPDALVGGMLKAKYLGKGLWAERQFFYGLTDMAFHTAPKGEVDTTRKQEEIFAQVEQFEPVHETFFHASFGHLIHYNAGYYGYMWSLVYAADMFERFKQLGMLDPEAGMYYRRKILARGGTIDELEMVKDYLGREPRMEPFLAQLGLSDGN